MRRLHLAVLALGFSACTPARVDLRHVTEIRTATRFVDAGTEAVTPAHVITGDRLRSVLDAARCREGLVLWKGGIPATLILEDGSRLSVDGFSFYGRFLRVSRRQWCELTEDGWRALWQP